MTDSRAALEESLLTKISKEWPARTPAAQELIRYVAKVAADAVESVEQESSSLKLLLSAMCKNYASMTVDPHGNILSIRKGVDWHDFPVELDSSGIPVLTEEILKALEAAK